MIFLKENNSKYSVGGKAKNLFILKELGMNVPVFGVVPAEGLELLLPNKKLTLLQDIDSIEIPSSFIHEILSYFVDHTYFSVRSSGIDEDGEQFSFAGQFESFLYVTKDNLSEKIKEVWKSAYSKRVEDYRKDNNLSSKARIAVIIQVMIDSDASGVAFGVNPVTGNRNEKIISAVYGLGEGLVSGELNADNFCVSEKGIQQKIVRKEYQVKFNQSLQHGTHLVEVESNDQNNPVISMKVIEKLVQLLDVLFSHYRKYQDVEFAVEKEEVYVLQTRPITNLNSLPDPSGEYIIWDNSNIIESYPGISSPLTFSFISKVYEAVYRQFAEIMGVKPQDIDNNKEIFANMLGFIDGRVYYNLLSWYGALALLPGYSLNAEFMEKMMGVKERFELKNTSKNSKFKERLRVVRLIRIMLKNLRTLPAMKQTFVADFNATMTSYEAINFKTKNAFELMQLYQEFEQTLLKKWKAPLVNDFYAMIYFGVLQKLVVKYKIDTTGTVHNDLISGAQDIISTEPIHRCIKISEMISADFATKELFLKNDAATILSKINTVNPIVQEEINCYISKFGNRCVGELKLETITYHQEPVHFISLIKSYVEQGISSTSFSTDAHSILRKNGEKQVKKALKGRWIKRIIFNYVLKRARTMVSDRENLRFERTRGFGMIRTIVNAIGDQFYAEGIILDQRDIYYLSVEEIFAYIKGTSINADLQALIDLRKNQQILFEAKTTSERIPTNGIVYLGNNFNPVHADSIHEGDLQGVACCAGIVRAKVQLVKNPAEVQNLNGDILVTSSTDPGWVTLFPTASGILVERGSLLSHSAIVSREMGKPCIVGITGLLVKLKTGDFVEMDGSTGVVRIIE